MNIYLDMDTQKMVKKTVTWEMFNGEDIRPFMNYPEDIIQDLEVVNDGDDIDFNKEHKYSNVLMHKLILKNLWELMKV